MITIVIADFRAQFTQFSDVFAYPDDKIQMWFDAATDIMNNAANCFMREPSQRLALYLLTAHLLLIQEKAAQGAPIQLLQNATEGTVTIGYTPPLLKNGFQWWLSATPYGQQLWALLQVVSSGGFYLAGSYVRSGIRKPSGAF